MLADLDLSRLTTIPGIALIIASIAMLVAGLLDQREGPKPWDH